MVSLVVRCKKQPMESLGVSVPHRMDGKLGSLLLGCFRAVSCLLGMSCLDYSLVETADEKRFLLADGLRVAIDVR